MMKRRHTKIEIRQIYAIEAARMQLFELGRYCSYYSFGFNGQRGKKKHWNQLVNLLFQHQRFLTIRLMEMKEQKYHPPLGTVSIFRD